MSEQHHQPIPSLDERLALVGRFFLADALDNIEAELRSAEMEGDAERFLKALRCLEMVRGITEP